MPNNSNQYAITIAHKQAIALSTYAIILEVDIMSLHTGIITDFVIGDDLIIDRTITGLSEGVIITTAWFTVKRKVTDVDDDALIMKEINAANIADIGWIEDTGTDGEALIHFYITPEETGTLQPYSNYRYGIKLLLGNGIINTPESGIITALAAIKQGIG